MGAERPPDLADADHVAERVLRDAVRPADVTHELGFTASAVKSPEHPLGPRYRCITWLAGDVWREGAAEERAHEDTPGGRLVREQVRAHDRPDHAVGLARRGEEAKPRRRLRERCARIPKADDAHRHGRRQHRSRHQRAQEGGSGRGR